MVSFLLSLIHQDHLTLKQMVPREQSWENIDNGGKYDDQENNE
jgi:hypothetical protein